MSVSITNSSIMKRIDTLRESGQYSEAWECMVFISGIITESNVQKALSGKRVAKKDLDLADYCVHVRGLLMKEIRQNDIDRGAICEGVSE